MKRPLEIPKKPLKAPILLHNLTQVKPTLVKMQQNGQAYGRLIGIILAVEPEATMPTGKIIQQQLGISGTVYRQWLEALYADFITLIAADGDALQFKEVEHVFYLPGQGEGLEVKCRLAVTPRVGESVELPFLGAFAKGGTFYVSHVTHEYLQEKTLIHVSLRAGYYDAYAVRLQERASFENKWPREAWVMSDYERKELLRKLYPDG